MEKMQNAIFITSKERVTQLTFINFNIALNEAYRMMLTTSIAILAGLPVPHDFDTTPRRVWAPICVH